MTKQLCAECLKVGVERRSTFGKPGNERIACSLHKTEDMIDLLNRNKLCIECLNLGIDKHASYGIDTRTHCAQHKTKNMSPLINPENKCKSCFQNGIFRRASFGKSNDENHHAVPSTKNLK